MHPMWSEILSIFAIFLSLLSFLAFMVLAHRLADAVTPLRKAFDRQCAELIDDVDRISRATVEEADQILEKLERRVEDVKRERAKMNSRRGGQNRGRAGHDAQDAVQRPYATEEAYKDHLERGGAVDLEFEAALNAQQQDREDFGGPGPWQQ